MIKLMQSWKENYFWKPLEALQISPVNGLFFPKATIKAQINEKESKKDCESCYIQLKTAMYVFEH